MDGNAFHKLQQSTNTDKKKKKNHITLSIVSFQYNM